MGLATLLGFPVLFAIAGLAVGLSNGGFIPHALGSWLYFAAPLVAAAFVVLVMVARQRGTVRFRELWRKEHGTPVDAQ